MKKTVCALCMMMSPVAFAVAKCKPMDAVAKEAVEYSLLGAWMPFSNPACFKGRKFKFFDPSAPQPEGDMIDPSKVVFFTKGKDRYVIKDVKPDGQESRIVVEFTVNGKTLKSTFNYAPAPEASAQCGVVTNSQHMIIREDCVNQDEWKKMAPAAQ